MSTPDPRRRRKLPTTAALSPKKERVALMLASGASVRRAARDASVSERSIRTWRKEQAFVELVNDYHDAATARCSVGLRPTHIEPFGP